MSGEFPKMLYGQPGWDDLTDNRIVYDEQEESAARADGYSDLGSIDSSDDNDVVSDVPKRRGRPPKVQ